MFNKFPSMKYNNFHNYFNDYFQDFDQSLKKIDKNQIKKITKLLEKTYKTASTIYVCGNGGSAAIANHFECDHKKILNETKKTNPRIISLCTNNPLITALANDISYNSIFKKQLEYLAKKRDLLITISSSGNSENIIQAIKYAKKNGIIVISFTGFDGGRSRKLCDHSLHVDSYNYGVVENLHHAIMNITSQYIRNNILSDSQIKKIKF